VIELYGGYIVFASISKSDNSSEEILLDLPWQISRRRMEIGISAYTITAKLFAILLNLEPYLGKFD
jgi:hypothetical protein